ncbi:MAG: ABC transporter substrate binding protein [Pseudomonadota bacterium]
MPATPSSMHLPTLRAAARRWSAAVCMGLCAGLAAGSAAGAVTVLLGDALPAHAEFARALREGAEPGGTANDDDRSVVAGVRTRSLRNAASPGDAPVTVAVGAAASRSAIERAGHEPLLLAMLSRLDYESLRSHPALRRGDRRVGVLLRDPAVADTLALIDAVLPQKRRLGVVTTVEAEPLLRELQRAAVGWELQIQYAPDASALATALRTVVLVSDALLVLPDAVGDNQAATLAVLRAAAAAGLPVFGSSDGLVRSGGLAATVSTPAQLALQARALCERLASGGAGSATLIETASPATVRVNQQVARGLGLRLPDERELGRRISALR